MENDNKYSDEQIGEYWDNIGTSHEWEPIIEGGELDKIMCLLIKDLRDSSWSRDEIYDTLMENAKAYLTGSMENAGVETDDENEELQAANRADLINDDRFSEEIAEKNRADIARVSGFKE